MKRLHNKRMVLTATIAARSVLWPPRLLRIAAAHAHVGPAKLNRPTGEGTGFVLARRLHLEAVARPERTPLT
jgi:hypothetical protein